MARLHKIPGGCTKGHGFTADFVQSRPAPGNASVSLPALQGSRGDSELWTGEGTSALFRSVK